MKQLFQIIWRGVGLLALTALLLVLVPGLWLVWRVHQPMELPQFGGHTYLEFVAWQKQDMARAAEQYGWDGWGENCYPADGLIYHGVGLPATLVAAITAVAPEFFHRERLIAPKWIEQGFVPPDHISVWEVLPAWWLSYEKNIWYVFSEAGLHSPILACRYSRASFDAWARSGRSGVEP